MLLNYIVSRYNLTPFLAMNTTDSIPLEANPPAADHGRELADFRTDRRVLLLCALAVPIGLIGAVVAKALLWLIAAFTNLAFFLRFSAQPVEPQQHHLGWWMVLVPVIGGLIIGLMARYGSEKIRGHGIPEALEAILLGRSLIKPKVAILKPVSSAVSIGTGGPFGAEGPIIMTGGAFGSMFAQLFHLTAAERKTLLVAGAAAGMSAVFATPVAAVLLAVELLLFEWKPRSFIPVVVSAVIASVTRVPLLGAGPIFPVTMHAMLTPSALAMALLVGVCAGLGSGLLTALVYACEDAFLKLPFHWMWWPAIGGLAIGVGGMIDPRVLGVGYETIHGLMRGEVLGAALVSLLLAKGIVWAVALGSGTSGGVLAPLLMMGGAIGALLGQATGFGDPGLWAMVGMGAMMGGTMRSPLTGLVFVLELTHDFHALPALLVGSVAALCVTVLLLKRSILTEKLARRGQHIAREYSVDVFELMRVADVMDRTPPCIPATTTVSALADKIARGDSPVAHRQATLLVDDKGELTGIITRGDIMSALQRDPARTSVLEAASTDLVVAHPDETLHDVIARMLKHDIGRLPVVERGSPRRVVGYLGRADILSARSRQHEEEERRERGPLLGGAAAAEAPRAGGG
jgi:H+/Cl- antiporter ClcA/CBS domain-containing protein